MLRNSANMVWKDRETTQMKFWKCCQTVRNIGKMQEKHLVSTYVTVHGKMSPRGSGNGNWDIAYAAWSMWDASFGRCSRSNSHLIMKKWKCEKWSNDLSREELAAWELLRAICTATRLFYEGIYLLLLLDISGSWFKLCRIKNRARAGKRQLARRRTQKRHILLVFKQSLVFSGRQKTRTFYLNVVFAKIVVAWLFWIFELFSNKSRVSATVRFDISRRISRMQGRTNTKQRPKWSTKDRQLVYLVGQALARKNKE